MVPDGRASQCQDDQRQILWVSSASLCCAITFIDHPVAAMLDIALLILLLLKPLQRPSSSMVNPCPIRHANSSSTGLAAVVLLTDGKWLAITLSQTLTCPVTIDPPSIASSSVILVPKSTNTSLSRSSRADSHHASPLRS